MNVNADPNRARIRRHTPWVMGGRVHAARALRGCDAFTAPFGQPLLSFWHPAPTERRLYAAPMSADTGGQTGVSGQRTLHGGKISF